MISVLKQGRVSPPLGSPNAAYGPILSMTIPSGSLSVCPSCGRPTSTGEHMGVSTNNYPKPWQKKHDNRAPTRFAAAWKRFPLATGFALPARPTERPMRADGRPITAATPYSGERGSWTRGLRERKKTTRERMISSRLGAIGDDEKNRLAPSQLPPLLGKSAAEVV